LITVALVIPPVAFAALFFVSGFASWLTVVNRDLGEGGFLGSQKAEPIRVLTGRRVGRVSAYVIVGSYVAALGVAGGAAAAGALVCPDGRFVPLAATACGCVFAGATVFRRGRHVAMLDADEAESIDERPPVLYLRSFADDRVTVRSRHSRRQFWPERLGGPSRERFEEVLAWHLWAYGPVVTIEEPKRRKPTIAGNVLDFIDRARDVYDLELPERSRRLGAARESLSPTRWRQNVEDRIASARLIAVTLGHTEGLAWELACLTRLGLWAKTILIFPPVGDEELDRRWRTFRETAADAGLDLTLPADAGVALVAVVRATDGVIVYVGRRQDERHYEAAIAQATATLGVRPTPPPPFRNRWEALPEYRWP
jgi:hypothetical protein